MQNGNDGGMEQTGKMQLKAELSKPSQLTSRTEVQEEDLSNISVGYDAITIDFMADELLGMQDSRLDERTGATDLLNKVIDRSESVTKEQKLSAVRTRDTATEDTAVIAKDRIETQPDSVDLVGVILQNRFEVVRSVGRGSQAHVFLAQDVVLQRQIALKILLDAAEYSNSDDAADKAETRYISTVGHSGRQVSKAELKASFLKEAQLASRVSHPGCLSIYDFGEDQGISYILMEFFDGYTLRALLKGGRLDAVLALRLTLLIAKVLEAVHQAGIVHRDIKPSNILVDREARVKLTDFGVAACIQEDDTHHLMVGTYRYMAPEQALGEAADPRADIFSLGTVLWEMLTGFPAFPPGLEALQERIALEAPPLPPDVYASEKTRDILAKCMAPEPENRYLSVSYLTRELASAIEAVKN